MAFDPPVPVQGEQQDVVVRTDGKVYLATTALVSSLLADGAAIAAFILGRQELDPGALAWWFVAAAAVLAIVAGGVALRVIARWPDPLRGKGLAVLGIVVGSLALVMVVIEVAFPG